MVSTRQADVEQVPIKRDCHGTCLRPQKDVDQGSRRLGSTDRQLRARKRKQQQVRPCQMDRLHGTQCVVGRAS